MFTLLLAFIFWLTLTGRLTKWAALVFPVKEGGASGEW